VLLPIFNTPPIPTPPVTTTRDDGTKAVRYDRLVPLLIEAIKELDGRIKTLEG